MAATPTADGGLEWTDDLPPLAERVFVLTRRDDGGLEVPEPFTVREAHSIPGPFAYALDEPNLCVLDFAAWQLADGPWEPEAEILKIDEAVRARVGLAPRGGTMVQPWARPASEEARPHGRLRLRFIFDVGTVPAGPVELLVETPERFAVAINGVRTTAAEGWRIDPCLRRVPVPAGALRAGENRVELEAEFTDDLNLETIYLAGNFGVSLAGRRATLGALPERLAVGDIAAQGLPFYSGKISWRLSVPAEAGPGRARLALQPVGCAAVKVRAADGTECLLPWAPFEADLGKLDGTGELTCETYLTRRNTFGPLHEVPRVQSVCGPNSFRTGGERFSEEYQLFPCGFAAAPTVSYDSAL
ncbi:MAG: hypothetical protein INR65_11715 [Gluconacetobacter diazotrophicus]|nr:hypothetical protein [Gluconacetobacter diazotrophicus]